MALVLLVIWPAAATLLASPAPARAAARERITPGPMPPGWTIEKMRVDNTDFVFWRMRREIGESYQSLGGYIDAMHDPWARYGTDQDFLKNADKTLENERNGHDGPEGFSGDSGTTKLGGRDFVYVRWTRRSGGSDPEDSPVRSWAEYYSDVSEIDRRKNSYDSDIYIKVIVSARNEAEFTQLDAQVQQIPAGLKFDFTKDPEKATQGEPAAPTEQPGFPWRTATGGAMAVAAAAAAIAGAAASARGKKTKLDPNEHVGYVLDLSTTRIRLASASSAELKVAVWRVLASGQVEPTTDAQVSLVVPSGVQASPLSGAQPLTASVWQDGDPPAGSAIFVRATAAKGGTQARVDLVAEDASELVMAVKPAGGKLKPTGRDVLMVEARLEPSLAALADPAGDMEAARASIAFAQPTSAEWLDVGESRDTRLGKELPVSMSTPDPNRQLTPPESVTVSATATVGKERLAASVTIPVEQPPSIDARPDSVKYSAGTGEETEVLVWIEAPGDLEWRFDGRYKEGDRPLATFMIEPKTASTAVITLTENAGKLPDAGVAEEAATLVVTGSAEGWDPLERYIRVIVSREGLFVDATGRDPDGTFHIEAKGESRPTEIDVRVYARDAEGAIALDEELSKAVEWAPGGEEGTAGGTALGFDEFSIGLVGMRPSSRPSATYRAVMGRKLPTSGDPIAATLHAQVPGLDDPKFAADVAVKLMGVDTSPYSAEWRLERERCLEIIAEYAPLDMQQRLRDLVYEKGPLMGAEGLYELRKRIWRLSENALRQEAADYLTKAWTYEQIEGVLDWVSWCGDIAFAVASGRILGTSAALALGLLKPILVSAMTAYVDGKDMSWWATEQVKLAIGVIEGQATDPDLIAHMTGKNKALIWAIFIAYTFVKNWAMDPEHRITKAMEDTARMLRDQALISFLRWTTGAVPTKIKTTEAKLPPPPKPDRTPTYKPKPEFVPKPGKAPKAPVKPTAKAPAKPTAGGAGAAAPGKPAAAGPAKPGAKPTRKPPAPGSVVKPGPGAKKQAPATKPPKLAPEFDAPDAKSRATKMADAAKAKTKPGPHGPEVDADTMEKIMRDPDAARELKKNDPNAWKAYDNARKKVYGKHDRQLEGWIKDNVPEAKGQKVEVRSVGTPDGVDRDYRAGIVRRDPVTGKKVFVEIPKEKWAGKSQEIFSEVTGGPKDPAGAAEWARGRQQLATDGYHSEASVDMADQGWVDNPRTGKRERTQVTSNYELTKKGKSTLMDPDGLGKTYETKVANSYHEGNTLDAYRQAEKASHSLTEVRTGYAAQDYKVGKTPPEVLKGMQIIEKVVAGDMKPEVGDAALAEAGLGSNLPEFMQRLSGEFAGLKFAHK